MSPVRLSFIKGYSLISAHDPEDPTDPIIGAKPVAEGSLNPPKKIFCVVRVSDDTSNGTFTSIITQNQVRSNGGLDISCFLQPAPSDSRYCRGDVTTLLRVHGSGLALKFWDCAEMRRHRLYKSFAIFFSLLQVYYLKLIFLEISIEWKLCTLLSVDNES